MTSVVPDGGSTAPSPGRSGVPGARPSSPMVPGAAEARRVLAGVASRAVLGDDDAVVEAWATVAWNLLTEPGDGIAGRLLDGLGPTVSLGVFDDLSMRHQGVTDEELRAGLARWRPRLASLDVGQALGAARRHGVRLLSRGDAEWPEGLADLGDHQPLCLWALGDPTRLRGLEPAVAIVGARAATGYGEHVAMEIASEVAGAGVAVVSGAAYGIDGAAHRAALAAGGLTVALLAGGVDRPYPAGHAHLVDRIAAAGVVLSEVPCGGAPTKWRFLARNRLIAALSGATVVVEAGWRSGSLNTAGHAAELGRPLGAVPGPVTSATSAGCHRLLRDYDARCVTSADEVLELLGLDGAPSRIAGQASPERSRVLDALSARTARPVADLAGRAGMSEADIEAALGLLAVEGLAEPMATGWRRVPGGG